MTEIGDAGGKIEDGLISLKNLLSKYMTAGANAGEAASRAGREADNNRRLAEECENRAISYLKKMRDGSMDRHEADRLALEALEQKQEYELQGRKDREEADKMESEAQRFRIKVNETKEAIRQVEGEMLSLKARARAAQAARRAAEITADFDPSPALNLIRRMTEKVEQEEALAEAYGQMVDDRDRLDAEIDKALGSDGADNVSLSLEKMKKDLGLA